MKRRVIVDLGCALVVLAAATSLFGQADAEFAKANQEFGAGRFKEAVSEYEAIARSGQWSANLFYNLGNACFRAGDFGRAVLNYRRALALDRHHPEAEANLRITRDQARALELSAPPAERMLRFATANQFAVAAAVAFWIAALAVVRLLLAPRRAVGAMTLSIFFLLIFGGAAFAAYELENGTSGKDAAVIIGSEVEARVATADTAHAVLALPPGSEIRILSTRGEWIYAALPNNLRGWLPATSVERVRPL